MRLSKADIDDLHDDALDLMKGSNSELIQIIMDCIRDKDRRTTDSFFEELEIQFEDFAKEVDREENCDVIDPRDREDERMRDKCILASAKLAAVKVIYEDEDLYRDLSNKTQDIVEEAYEQKFKRGRGRGRDRDRGRGDRDRGDRGRGERGRSREPDIRSRRDREERTSRRRDRNDGEAADTTYGVNAQEEKRKQDLEEREERLSRRQLSAREEEVAPVSKLTQMPTITPIANIPLMEKTRATIAYETTQSKHVLKEVIVPMESYEEHELESINRDSAPGLIKPRFDYTIQIDGFKPVTNDSTYISKPLTLVVDNPLDVKIPRELVKGLPKLKQYIFPVLAVQEIDVPEALFEQLNLTDDTNRFNTIKEMFGTFDGIHKFMSAFYKVADDLYYPEWKRLDKWMTIIINNFLSQSKTNARCNSFTDGYTDAIAWFNSRDNIDPLVTISIGKMLQEYFRLIDASATQLSLQSNLVLIYSVEELFTKDEFWELNRPHSLLDTTYVKNEISKTVISIDFAMAQLRKNKPDDYPADCDFNPIQLYLDPKGNRFYYIPMGNVERIMVKYQNK